MPPQSFGIIQTVQWGQTEQFLCTPRTRKGPVASTHSRAVGGGLVATGTELRSQSRQQCRAGQEKRERSTSVGVEGVENVH